MKLRVAFLLPLLLLLVSCDFPGGGECGPQIPIPWDQVDGQTFAAGSSCRTSGVRQPVGPVEMRLEREEGRIYVSYDIWESGGAVRVEEVWELEP